MSELYCEGANKATVDFKLGATKDSVLVERNLPISVEVQSHPAHTYKIKFQFRGCPGDREQAGCWVVGANFPNKYPSEAGNQPSEGDYFVSIFSLSGPPTQEGGPHPFCPGCPKIAVKGPDGNVLLDNLANASWELLECSIVVRDSTGAIAFERSGECPIDFTVACGEECPPGYCKCSTLKYPGYCCCKCNGNH